MATKDEIKAALLKVAGNPSSGAIADLADEMAQAVAALDGKKASATQTDVRVVESKETR